LDVLAFTFFGSELLQQYAYDHKVKDTVERGKGRESESDGIN
jgi:hypothetical protein